MTWQQRRRLARFLRSSVWPLPALAIAVALTLGPGLRILDEHTRWVLLGLGPDGARNILGALSASLLTFVIFAFSTLLIAVQIASAQLTPRIIARVFEGRLTKATLSAFLFSWVYSLEALGRVEDPVPQLPVAFALGASLVSTVLFVVLIQRISQVFRPVTVLSQIARETGEAIAGAYPPRGGTADAAAAEPSPGPGVAVVRHPGPPGSLAAFAVDEIVALAARWNGVVRIVPGVGDHVARGDELFRVHGEAVRPEDAAALLACVDVGPERMLRGDPLFGFRILVDVAARALSPGINDPATAVQVIDQLQHLLADLAGRELGSEVVCDASGCPRAIRRVPHWDDFVTLAMTEVRLYGAGSPQVTRRLRAMIDHLLERVPEERRRALVEQAECLERTVTGTFSDEYDVRLAIVPDRQGFGSPARQVDGSRG